MSLDVMGIRDGRRMVHGKVRVMVGPNFNLAFHSIHDSFAVIIVHNEEKISLLKTGPFLAFHILHRSVTILALLTSLAK